MMCISIVVHQFNRMHPWSTWEGMLPGRCSPGKRCHTFWDVNIVLLRVVSGKVHCAPENSARVTESLAQTDVSFCQSKMLYILDNVNFVCL